MSQVSLTGEGDAIVPISESPSYDEIRPLSVRMRDSIRAQLDVLAQLNDRSVTEETRLALEHWVERAKTDPSLKERADRVRAQIDHEAENRRKTIERDVAARRSAIAAVLGSEDAEAESPKDTKRSPSPGTTSASPKAAPAKPGTKAAQTSESPKAG